jgi:hypothetical protein
MAVFPRGARRLAIRREGRHLRRLAPARAATARDVLMLPLMTDLASIAAIRQCYVIEEWVHHAVHFHRFEARRPGATRARAQAVVCFWFQ